MRHLVQDHRGPQLVHGITDARTEHEWLPKDHAAYILHSPGSELRHEDLVVFGERIVRAEQATVIVKALPGDRKDVLVVQVPRQRGAARYSKRNHLSAWGGVQIADKVIFPGSDRGEIRRYPRRRREVPHCSCGHARGAADRLRRRLVRKHRPVCRALIWNENDAFRSGCSKLANTLRASRLEVGVVVRTSVR